MVTYGNHKVCSPSLSGDGRESQPLWACPHTIVVFICLALTLFSTAQIRAQTAPFIIQFPSVADADGAPEGLQPLPPGIELPPGVQLPAGINPGKETTSKTNAPASPEEKRLQE